MENGKVLVYYGKGKGKTSVAIGRGIRALGEGKRVVMIQFLDYYNTTEISFMRKLEPDFRIFHFDKARDTTELTEAMRKEVSFELRSAFNFANKIVETGECEMLLLDGILECVHRGFLEEDDVLTLLDKKADGLYVILTGDSLPDQIRERADYIYCIQTEKVDGAFI